MKISYKSSGVDIEASNKFINDIKNELKKTYTELVVNEIGNFNSIFKIPSGYDSPLLISSSDGVGTKLKIAVQSGEYSTIGIDLVAMCVNDIICSFAQPLFFLDYYATSKLDISRAKNIIEGIAKGCIEAKCSLVGGETAEMPGIYHNNEFDIAGFCVGIAEEKDVKKRETICDGDILIALPSNGLHSNGFSLIRKLFFEELNMKYDDEFNGVKLYQELLKPTKIYLREFNKVKRYIKGGANVTGGGLYNITRALPKGFNAHINKDKLLNQYIFKFLSKYIDEYEMFKTFNCDVGFVLITSKKSSIQVLKTLDKAYIIGQIENGNNNTIIN